MVKTDITDPTAQTFTTVSQWWSLAFALLLLVHALATFVYRKSLFILLSFGSAFIVAMVGFGLTFSSSHIKHAFLILLAEAAFVSITCFFLYLFKYAVTSNHQLDGSHEKLIDDKEAAKEGTNEPVVLNREFFPYGVLFIASFVSFLFFVISYSFV